MMLKEWNVYRPKNAPQNIVVSKEGEGIAVLRPDSADPKETILYRYFDGLLGVAPARPGDPEQEAS